MDEKDLILLTETAERCKSNTHQIEEVKVKMATIEAKQEAIYELTTSVKLIAQDMCSIKDSINDVKQGQNELAKKVDEQINEVKGQIKEVDLKSKVDFIELFKTKVIPVLFGSGCILGLVELIKYYLTTK